MTDVKKAHARGAPYEQDLEERLKDPEFARAYKELEAEFQVIRQIVALRNQRKITQAELAKRVGTTQSSIARMESNEHVGTLNLLQRVADALDARLEVRLIPKEPSRIRGRKHRTAST